MQTRNTTALPTSRTFHHGLGAYFIQPVEEQNRFLAEPCLLHPTLPSLVGSWDYFNRQTFYLCIGTQLEYLEYDAFMCKLGGLWELQRFGVSSTTGLKFLLEL